MPFCNELLFIDFLFITTLKIGAQTIHRKAQLTFIFVVILYTRFNRNSSYLS